uniref:C-type lectin domain family 17, member A-like n=1 Tax=Semicossyphus pulcher TaxID=241346 RepID=UPI0037E85F8F
MQHCLDIWEVCSHNYRLVAIGRYLYHFVKSPKTWREAQSYCRGNFADMATVESMAEHQRLKEIVGNSEVTWIGLERSPPKRWVWTDGAGDVKVFEWTRANFDCTYMKANGFWDTLTCGERLASLCYYRRWKQ